MKIFNKCSVYALCLLALISLASCSGGSGESDSGSTQHSDSSADDVDVTTSASVNEELLAAQEEIDEVSSSLNESETYQLDQEELDLLLAENAISEEEYNELLSLIK